MNGYLIFLLSSLIVPTLLIWAESPPHRGPELVHKDFTKCEPDEVLTDKDPFFVSATDGAGMEDKEWENFRNFADYSHVLYYLPRMAIVRPLDDAEVIKRKEESSMDTFPPDHYVPVKVMSIRDPKAFEVMKTNRRLARRADPKSPRNSKYPNKKLSSASIGDVGLVWGKSLRPAKDFNFVVTKDTAFLKMPKALTDSLAGKTVRLATKDGKYRTRICCEPTNAESCITNYIFQVLKDDPVAKESDRIVERELAMTPQWCEPILNALNPVTKAHTDAIRSILNQMEAQDPTKGIRDLEFFDSEGLVKVPVDYKDLLVIDTPGPGEVTVQMGPGKNALHYTPDDAHSGDAYNDPVAVCTFLQVTKKWEKICPPGTPGCTLQWGNAYHPPNWGIHGTHGSKSCFDIRPMRRQDDVGGVYCRRDSNYDREKTAKLIALLNQAGGVGILNDGSYSELFFDDSKIEGRRTVSNSDHCDHIHVCFPADVPAVNNACNKGL